MQEQENLVRVAIIGAGPAGLFAARQLVKNGVGVALFNRDIKPGGLAEYGIFPDKYALKEGFRKQFREILATTGIHYFGNVTIGEDAHLNLTQLRKMGFSAILVAAGAQGTKKLGLAGEDCPAVFHAKELVYHYNQLPPFATQDFRIGARVAVLGVGNVMTDVVRYLLTQPRVKEITTFARRGLAEVKFDSKELAPIAGALDWPDFLAEVERIHPAMQAINQDPAETFTRIQAVHDTAAESFPGKTWRLRFLYSVRSLNCGPRCLQAVDFEQNVLEREPEGAKAKGTGNIVSFPCDTLIFAIGDQVDAHLGLPVQNGRFLLKEPPLFSTDGNTYETQTAGIFVCGWARNASKGMVGIARRDGVNAAKSILQYLASSQVASGVAVNEIQSTLDQAGYEPVTPPSLHLLEAEENRRAQQSGAPVFRFDTNEDMLQVMGLKK